MRQGVLEYHKSKGNNICRLCDDKINTGEECLSMTVWVSPRRRSLFFHKNCIENSMKELNKGDCN